MPRKKARGKAPRRKYHTTGREQLEMLVEEAETSRSRDEFNLMKRSFRDQVELVGKTHISHGHKAWRRIIRWGADIFAETEEEYVKTALDNLLAGERERRAADESARRTQEEQERRPLHGASAEIPPPHRGATAARSDGPKPGNAKETG